MKKDNMKRLCNYLVAAEDWITGEELASYLHTTPRTIRNYVQQINQKASSPPILSSSKGYFYQKNNEQRPYILNRSEPLTPEDRRSYIVRNLIWRKEIRVDDLLDTFAVSERTLGEDINLLRRLVKNFNLSLHRHKEILYLTGNEIDLRRLAVDCIHKTTQTNYLTSEFLKKAFPEIDVAFLLQLLNEILPQYKLSTNGYYRYELLFRAIIQLEQIQHGYSIQKEEFVLEYLEQTPDDRAAQQIADKLEQFFNCTYNKKEREYLTALLLSYTDRAVEIFDLPIPLYQEVLKQLGKTLNDIGRQIDLDFSKEHFYFRMTHYSMRMAVRQHMKFFTNIPVVDALRDVHPLLLDFSAYIILQLLQCFPMPNPEYEAGGLALLLADYMYERFPFESVLSTTLICPDFGGLAKKIACVLENHVGNSLKIDHMITTTDIEDMPAHTDLILSVLPVKNIPHAVHISAMPNSEDYRLIRQEIRRIKGKRRQHNLDLYIRGYLRPENFEINHAFHDQEEAIHYICQTLTEQNFITPQFAETILLRETIDTTAFHNLIAIPHACNEHVKRNSIYMIVNHTPMKWHESSINIIIFISMQEELSADFRAMYGLFVHLFSKPQNVRTILRAENYEQFLTLIPNLKF